jgi:NADH dehydrogenase
VILVTGASGFVGRHVVRELAGAGERVRALVRGSKGAAVLEDVECELAVGDVTDPESLAVATKDCEAVVHLVAIIHGRPAEFDRVIAGGAANVAEAARGACLRRIVHMSALGVGEHTKDTVPYYRAKWQAEATVAGSGLDHAILRPSFVFGADGGALPRFLRIARLAPVTPVVGSGTQRLQPLWVDDLARAVRLALRGGDGVVELGGPDVVDWNELWRRIKTALGTTRPAIHLPLWAMRPQAFVLERLPSPPLTRDQLTMLTLGDNVVGDGGVSQARLGLGRVLTLDEQLQRAVAPERP